MTVTPPAHTVDSFTVDDTTPAIGDSVTFTWTTSNADSAALEKRFSIAWGTHVRSLALNGTHSISRDSAGSETYRLSISQNRLNVYSSPITTTWAASPPDDPVIDTFTADASTIASGGSTTLRWTTTDATSVTIPGTSGALAVDGSVSVSPTATTTYTLTASGASGTTAATQSVTVTVNLPDDPVIDTFTADASTIASGGSTTLRWTTTDATSVTIPGTSGALAVDGSVSVSPTATTTYTLTASGATGSTPATRSITITVNPPEPVIDTFTADASTITTGGSTTLRWTTTNATSVSISGVTATLAVDGSTSVSPTANTTYTLTAEGASGTTAATATVTIQISGWPTATLVAAPVAITSGESATLRWTTTNATSVSIDQGVGAVTPLAGGSVSVTPTATTTYTLTASDGDANSDDASASATVTVSPPETVIDSFSVDDSTPDVGDDATFTWTTTNADGVQLQRDLGFGWQNFGNTLAADGNTTVRRHSAGSREYRLRAYRGSTDVYSWSTTVTWRRPAADAPVIDTFTADATTITVGGSTTLRWTTTNATSVAIPGTSGALAVDGSVSVTPTATTTYTLTASDADAATIDATRSVTITVNPPDPDAPVIDTFTADATTITVGGSTTLRWTTTNATSVAIPGTSGALAVDGSVSVTPTATTTYTLTASDGDDATDDATASVTVTVNSPDHTVDSFTVDDTTPDVGDSVTFTWTTTNADGVQLQHHLIGPFGWQNTGSTLSADGSTTVSRSTSGSTEYRIRAYRGSTNVYSSLITVTWSSRDSNDPVIDTFTADATTITVGGSTTLRWTTTNATSVAIPGTSGALAVDGSVSVSPTTTTTYTLTASGASGTTPDDASVTINVKPRIDTFSADATTITRGNSTTLRWSTTGATSVTLDDTAVALDGNQTVSPTSDTTYELEASNSAGSNTRTVTITVRPPDPNDPEIDSFRASPTTITLGESTTLRWTTTNATSVRIPGTTGTLAVDGSTSVTPTTTPTTAYTLTARGATGTTPDTDTVTIKVKPRIDSFSASSTTITLGDQIRLRWSTTGATSVTLDDTAVALDGNQTVSPTSDTTYELEASNSAGSNTRTVTVTVDLPPCVIDSFSASPTTITRGGSSTLSWTTTNATSTSINQGVESVTPAASGSESVSPTATTTYTLTASGSDCTPDATDTATVTVVDPPVIDTFTATKTTITEGSSTTLRWTTTDATSVTLNETAVALDGSRNVSPTVDTTYTLKASNSADPPATDTETVSITVSPRSPTASLSVDPEEIFNPGDSATLTWSTSDATSAEIDEGVGSVTPVADGSTTVYPDTTTTYTLTATGPGGTATDTATVYTVDFQRTLTATLTADPLSITRGGSTTLSWATEGADSATIDQGVGAVTPVEGGSVSVSPTATTTYTLTATSGEGDDAVTTTASVEVTVTQPDPTIDSFSVDDATPETGETVTISWTTSHATSADLQRRSGNSWESVGTVALNGSHAVSRDSAGSESYQLLISRDNLAVLSAPITITWADPPAD